MSRIGRQPIDVPAGVTVTFTDGVISVKGPKGTLTQAVADQRIGISQEGAVITVTRASEDKKVRAMHGLYRALLNNVEMQAVFEKAGETMWECRNCGHLVMGKKAPEVCPVCAHPQSYFEVRKENY